MIFKDARQHEMNNKDFNAILEEQTKALFSKDAVALRIEENNKAWNRWVSERVAKGNHDSKWG